MRRTTRALNRFRARTMRRALMLMRLQWNEYRRSRGIAGEDYFDKEWYRVWDGKKAVACDMHEASLALGTDKHHLFHRSFGGRRFVSTVLLPIHPAPFIFETMIFFPGAELHESQERYQTYEEAREGHARHVKRVEDYFRERRK